MAKGLMAMSEKNYQAKYDADTLKTAKEIMADSKRYQAAQKASGALAGEKKSEAKIYQSIANKKVK